MTTDIFDFWSRIADDAERHPADADVLEHVHHGFEAGTLPKPMTGPLKDAPVVLLFLSPGLRPCDAAIAASKKGRDYYRRQRTGMAPLPRTDEHAEASKWWSKIVGQFGIDPEIVTDKIAFLNINAYHSERFDDWHMLHALPSSRVSLEWAQGALFPQAKAGERLVICLRSAKHWGLAPGSETGNLFAPYVRRDGRIRDDAVRDKISALVISKVG